MHVHVEQYIRCFILILDIFSSLYDIYSTYLILNLNIYELFVLYDFLKRTSGQYPAPKLIIKNTCVEINRFPGVGDLSSLLTSPFPINIDIFKKKFYQYSPRNWHLFSRLTHNPNSARSLVYTYIHNEKRF